LDVDADGDEEDKLQGRWWLEWPECGWSKVEEVYGIARKLPNLSID